MTDRDQGAFEAALQADLAAARQQNLVLSDQLRQANILNEGLAYKLDYMHQEVARVTASREQYERVAIRVSAKMEAATSMVMGQLAELQEEIRAAAFTKQQGPVQKTPQSPPEAVEPLLERLSGKGEPGLGIHGIPKEYPEGSFSLEMLGKLIGSDHEIEAGNPTSAIIATQGVGHVYEGGNSASRLPPPRFGNGGIK
jgi:hypothetical protein